MDNKIRKAIGDNITKDIVIIGKGPSVDKVNLEILKDFLVINVNDSEAIFPGQISVFHQGWVLDRFDHFKPKCNLYVTDREMPDDTESIKAKFVPYSPENADFLLNRFFSDEFYIEQAIVISAIRMAQEVAKISNTRKRVYLLGFDFSTKDGYSKKFEDFTHGLEDEYIERIISFQEKILEKLLLEKTRLLIDIFHIGTKPFSFYSPEAFNNLFSESVFNIKDANAQSDSHQNYNVKIVAEITTNHFGDIQRLEAMIKSSKLAGADYIKLQKRNVDTFYTQEQLAEPYNSPFGTTFGDYRRGIELSYEDFNVVENLCNKIGIGWFVSVLDIESYNFIKKFNPQIIKLPSTISEHKAYLKTVADDFSGDIIISTGFTDMAYEDFILKTFKNARYIYMLQCTSAYPTPMEHAQIGVIRHYYNLSKSNPKIIPGFSSHDIGSLCSMMAVASGARMIEKHVKFGDVTWSHFDQVAVDLANGDFKKFVDDVRKSERIVGSEIKTIHNSEHHKYRLPKNQND